ncbi:hypothetical protein TAMA11512_21520 [Selenomonas sp. TAMA-11512]|uniref:hypothetical protein n=1 Tax=Selenomonas sp. TAMA-11512 TaxID=3095337 RepID=UPI00308581DC|nr:hypothetical protein TAMA11512_21520 [Selenomonas sp. TAMA-11512]
MDDELYLYSFNEDGERARFYFSSVEEALDDARKNADEDETVYIWKEEEFELRVRGEELIEDMQCQLDEESIHVDLADPEKPELDELSDMLTKVFQEWADKHGYAKSVTYGTDTKLYDLKTGRPV